MKCLGDVHHSHRVCRTGWRLTEYAEEARIWSTARRFRQVSWSNRPRPIPEKYAGLEGLTGYWESGSLNSEYRAGMAPCISKSSGGWNHSFFHSTKIYWSNKRINIVWSHLRGVLRIGKLIETESRREFTRGQGRGDGKLLFNGNKFPVWDDANALGMDSNDGCTTLRI